MNQSNYSRGALTLPAAIIIAGALIAVALIYMNKPEGRLDGPSGAAETDSTAQKSGVPTVTATDHILGNPNAAIKLIVYSDLSCPFCKDFNPALVRITDEYGPAGNVAWVYRHFPLYKGVNGQIPHPNAGKQAEALECAAAEGGHKAFFDFEKSWFETFPETAGTRPSAQDIEALKKTAGDIGLDVSEFSRCLLSNRFADKIDQAFQEGLKAGVTGTPFTVIVTPSGNQIPIVGAETYAALKRTIDTLITTIPKQAE